MFNKKIVFNFKKDSIDILLGYYKDEKIDIYENIEILFLEDDYKDGTILNLDNVKNNILEKLKEINLRKYEKIVIINGYTFIKIKEYPFTSKKDIKNIIKYDLDNIFMDNLGKLNIDYIINDLDLITNKIEILYFGSRKDKIMEISELFNSMDMKITYMDHIINTILKVVNNIYKLESEYIYLEISGGFADIYYYRGRRFLEKYKLEINSAQFREVLEKIEFIIIDNHSDLEYIDLKEYEIKILSYKSFYIGSLGGLIRYGQYFL